MANAQYYIEICNEEVMLQLALRTVHEVFEGDDARHCDVVVYNAVVEDVDRATGKDFEACILSLQAERDAFEAIDLQRVDPRACSRSLMGVSGRRLSQMQPVRPLRVLDTEDPRFIEADGVLADLAADENLMTMEWQDFEVLVRDLFETMFADRGAEVKVTRTSRDQGVDAVVFDPKGILVTTSHFGAGAREFSKDKPLTLVDGANLLHLLQNHGHNVRIDLTETRDDFLSDPVKADAVQAT